MPEKKIFLTGATGFLGSYILRLILLKSDSSVNLLIRGNSQIEAEKRMHYLLKRSYMNKCNKQILRRIQVIQGDQTKEYMGLTKIAYKGLLRSTEEIYHCAALAEFKMPLEKVRFINVFGTENILKFAEKCRRLTKLSYISTAFIAGNKVGLFKEEDLDTGQTFNNTYEQSKFEAELLIRKYIKKGLRISIFRPSIIVGEYLSGETTNFRMFYKPFRSIALGLFKEIPLGVNTFLNLIPVDSAAQAIYTLATREDKIDVYHIVSPQHILVKHLMDIAAIKFEYKNPKYIPTEDYNFKKLSLIQKQILDAYFPYFNYRTIFDSNKTQKTLRKYNFKYPDINDNFLYRIFDFCKTYGYIRLKFRTNNIY